MTNDFGNDFENNKKDIDVLFSSEYKDFLHDIDGKLELFSEKSLAVENQKKKIIKRISETKKEDAIEHKELMDFIHDSESALESIDTVYKNLNALNNEYINFEKDLLIVSQRLRLGIDDNELIPEVEKLSKKIDEIKSFEESIKLDNDKNYLIINSFTEKSLVDNNQSDEPIDFDNLTIDNLKDNLVLRICEKKVELPYTKKEVEDFLKTYPNDYKTVQDVISKEFVMHLAVFNKHPILSRFKEAYYLCRMKEMMTIVDSFGYAKRYMFESKLNPYIIAAVKSKRQLEEYMGCLENNRLNDFKYFKIVFEVTPM